MGQLQEPDDNHMGNCVVRSLSEIPASWHRTGGCYSQSRKPDSDRRYGEDLKLEPLDILSLWQSPLLTIEKLNVILTRNSKNSDNFDLKYFRNLLRVEQPCSYTGKWADGNDDLECWMLGLFILRRLWFFHCGRFLQPHPLSKNGQKIQTGHWQVSL